MGRLLDVDVYGPAKFVHPSMYGSYMEHAMGAASVAHEIMLTLRESYPGLLITDADVECVTVAALIRHIGALPWSPVLEELLQRNRSGVSMEHRSIRIAGRVFASSTASPVLAQHGVCLARVCEMMAGESTNFPGGVQWVGHDPAYMRDIVHAPAWGVDAFTIYRVKLLGRRTEQGDLDLRQLMESVGVTQGRLTMPQEMVTATRDLDAHCHATLFTDKLVSVYALASQAVQKSYFAHSMAHITLGVMNTDSTMMTHTELSSFRNSLFAQKVPKFKLAESHYAHTPARDSTYYVVDHCINGMRVFDTYTPDEGNKI